jgi:hypothetical protein
MLTDPKRSQIRYAHRSDTLTDTRTVRHAQISGTLARATHSTYAHAGVAGVAGMSGALR